MLHFRCRQGRKSTEKDSHGRERRSGWKGNNFAQFPIISGVYVALTEFKEGETVILDIPENVKYKVGGHYFRQSGAPAEASVRVFIYNKLVYETPAVQLNPLDMWEVLTIVWPTGWVLAAEDDVGESKITRGHQSPYFPAL